MRARQLARGALIGALYALTTFLALPLSSGLAQVRLSEALCVLPYFTVSAAPGLFIGCVIANIIAGGLMWDVVFGSLATFAAALCVRLMKKRGVSKWLMPLPSVLINAVVVGLLLRYAYGIPLPLMVCMAYVFVGQTLACYGLGMPLLLLLEHLPLPPDA